MTILLDVCVLAAVWHYYGIWAAVWTYIILSAVVSFLIGLTKQ